MEAVVNERARRGFVTFVAAAATILITAGGQSWASGARDFARLCRWPPPPPAMPSGPVLMRSHLPQLSPLVVSARRLRHRHGGEEGFKSRHQRSYLASPRPLPWVAAFTGLGHHIIEQRRARFRHARGRRVRPVTGCAILAKCARCGWRCM